MFIYVANSSKDQVLTKIGKKRTTSMFMVNFVFLTFQRASTVKGNYLQLPTISNNYKHGSFELPTKKSFKLADCSEFIGTELKEISTEMTMKAIAFLKSSFLRKLDEREQRSRVSLQARF